MNGRAERFFQDTDYWRSWSEVPDLTVDIDYALRAVRPEDRAVLDVPCGRGRLLKAVGRRQAVRPRRELGDGGASAECGARRMCPDRR